MYKETIKTAGEKMDKTISVIQKDLSTLRAGRANPQILDKITVDYYGTPTPLNQIGNISSPEPRMLVIAPWEPKMIGADRKGNSEIRHRHQPVQRRQGRPPARSGIERGAPQGAVQAGSQAG